MPPYDDWNKIDDEEEEEIQDASVSRLDARCSVLLSHYEVLRREERRHPVLYRLF